jgi:hypothetical protein
MPVNIQESIRSMSETYLGAMPVYNLTVANSHRYCANGIMVGNCRYAISYIDESAGGYIHPLFDEDDEPDTKKPGDMSKQERDEEMSKRLTGDSEWEAT